ncbi:MAG: homoserine O-acetyltransferase, partial [Thermoguttaceae bacterium]|nr:homoserine O-acetyltransferase [Thermoguttaceae bacterium]
MTDHQERDRALESSDSDRHARLLPFAQSVTFDAPFSLQHGGCLPEVTVVYETYGKLNAAGDNAVLICHALSGDSHVARHHPADDPGWWDLVVGPGKSIDTERYFVICPNLLGGCRGTTGPNSRNPATGRPYGADFPVITVADMVEVQRMLLDRLGIERLRCVVGGSLGGFMVLDWATRLPERTAGALAIATAPRLTSQALAFDIVARNAIIRDPHFHGGQYYDRPEGPLVGLALARMLGHITYLSREAMMQKFDANRLRPHDIQTQFETKFSVGSYLAYQADRFGERFDANSYLTLSMALDLFDLGATPAELAANLARSTCRWLLISFTSDWLFPAFQSREVVGALLAQDRPVSYCNVASNCGHDAFLLPDELDSYGELMRFFLANLDAPPNPSVDRCVADACDCDIESHSLTSIFHHRHRLDYDRIVELIPPEASVLDLGCGTGGLLARLRSRGHERL